MPYNKTVTYSELENLLESQAAQTVDTLYRAKRLFDKFVSFAADQGGSDAAIALALDPTGADVTEAMIADMRAAVQALHDLYQFADNGVLAQGDRFYSLLKYA